jgi:hypothetical protein
MVQYRSLVLAGILLWTGSQAASQAPPGRAPVPTSRPGERDDFGSPLDAKTLARAKAEALRADPGELARAKVAAARECLDARFKDFLAGRGTLDFLLEAQVLVFEAELAVSNTDAQRLAVYEQRWQQAWIAERINKLRYDSGRVAVQDYAQTVYNRLDAEIDWLQLRAKLQKK